MFIKLITISALLAGPVLAGSQKNRLDNQGVQRRQATRSEVASRVKRDDLVKRQVASPGPRPPTPNQPVCAETVFRAQVINTGLPNFDGSFARLQEIIFNDDTPSGYVIPPYITDINDAADFRLNTDCTLSTNLQAEEVNTLNVVPAAPASKIGGAYFDQAEVRKEQGLLAAKCELSEENILSCSVQNLNTFILCFNLDGDGNPIPTTDFVQLADSSSLPTDKGTCVPLTIQAVNPPVAARCEETDFKLVVKDTDEVFDGYYANTAVTDNDGTPITLVGPSASSAAEASTLRLNEDCSVTVLGADTEGFLLNTDFTAVRSGFGLVTLDSPLAIETEGRYRASCSISAEDTFSCSIPGLKTLQVCYSPNDSGDIDRSPFFLTKDEPLPDFFGTCAVPTLSVIREASLAGIRRALAPVASGKLSMASRSI